jgi:glycosyltransferase involved in cell wall biosynthesis
MDLPYLERIEWDRVDRLVAICPRNADILRQRFPAAAGKIELILNTVDTRTLEGAKRPGAEFRMGVAGISPKRKHPLLALRIFERLREQDQRYVLHIKGQDPLSYPWLRKRPEEVDYYRCFSKEVAASPHKQAVVFDPWGKDMPGWYSSIGFVLSTSEREGSHQVVAEGMAAGCVPVIRNWPGAELLYPERYIFSTEEEAAELVRSFGEPEAFARESRRAREEAGRKFEKEPILQRYESLMSELLD